MTNERDEKMALWIAFTVKEFTPDEIQILTTTLQTKVEEIKEIIHE